MKNVLQGDRECGCEGARASASSPQAESAYERGGEAAQDVSSRCCRACHFGPRSAGESLDPTGRRFGGPELPMRRRRSGLIKRKLRLTPALRPTPSAAEPA
ncbi:hypothetical protein AAFF_G00389430 [Aldrovandia affinis]|uniref:Uncharacterized protein n=1 Tax=Aldrovandia affinis TaxID=143900 RepID=A0AAD7SGF3_9TELE|nr:hypothetical protein AAFF_G00389430 [Aldrovandia affinis]